MPLRSSLLMLVSFLVVAGGCDKSIGGTPHEHMLRPMMATMDKAMAIMDNVKDDTTTQAAIGFLGSKEIRIPSNDELLKLKKATPDEQERARAVAQQFSEKLERLKEAKESLERRLENKSGEKDRDLRSKAQGYYTILNGFWTVSKQKFE